MKYFTIHNYETIDQFLLRVKFNIGILKYYNIKNISEIMGRGIRVITLTNGSQIVKLEINSTDLNAIKEKFPILKLNRKGIRKKIIRKDGLNNIEDLYN